MEVMYSLRKKNNSNSKPRHTQGVYGEGTKTRGTEAARLAFASEDAKTGYGGGGSVAPGTTL